MFLVNVNDIMEWVSSYISLFADDAMLLKMIKKKSQELHRAAELYKQDIRVKQKLWN